MVKKVVLADNPFIWRTQKEIIGRTLSAISRQEYQTIFNNFSNSFIKVWSTSERRRSPFATPSLICGKLYYIIEIVNVNSVRGFQAELVMLQYPQQETDTLIDCWELEMIWQSSVMVCICICKFLHTHTHTHTHTQTVLEILRVIYWIQYKYIWLQG
jgi:hypothetical protein